MNRSLVSRRLRASGLVLAGLTCLALVAFAFRARKDLWAEPLQRPENCDEILDSSRVYGNYEKVINSLSASKDLAAIPSALCFVDDLSSVGNSSRLAYRDIVLNYRNPDILYGALKLRLAEILDGDRKLGSKREARLAWPGVWLSEAALVGYRRTGQTRFLDLFVNYYDQVIERRDDKLLRFDDVHKKVMKAWGSTNLTSTRKQFSGSDQGPLWIAHITHNSRIVFPGTEFAVIVKDDPGLRRYSLKADRYTQVAEEVLAEFDSDRVVVPVFPGLTWYNRPLVDKYEPTNHVHMIARVWANLFVLTGEERFRDAVDGVIDVFGVGLSSEPGSLVCWRYAPVFVDQKQRKKYSNEASDSEPIWKATHTTQFLLQASQQGYHKAVEIAPKVARMLSTLTFQGDRVWASVSRGGGAYYDPKKNGLNPNFVALVTYGSVEPGVKRKVPELVSSRLDIFPRAWLFEAGLFAYANLLEIEKSP